MATDIAVVRAKLLQERQVLQDAVAAIDLPAETAAIEAAQAVYQQKARRWSLIQDKVSRLEVVQAQIDSLT
jgi:hypothetical protein